MYMCLLSFYPNTFFGLKVSARETPDDANGILNRICSMDQIHVLAADSALSQHGVVHEPAEMVPKVPDHTYDWKSLEFSGLSECDHFESLIKCTEPARHHDECSRVFYEHYLAHEKVLKFDELVEVWIWFLLKGECDIAAEA